MSICYRKKTGKHINYTKIYLVIDIFGFDDIIQYKYNKER